MKEEAEQKEETESQKALRLKEEAEQKVILEKLKGPERSKTIDETKSELGTVLKYIENNPNTQDKAARYYIEYLKEPKHKVLREFQERIRTKRINDKSTISAGGTTYKFTSLKPDINDELYELLKYRIIKLLTITDIYKDTQNLNAKLEGLLTVNSSISGDKVSDILDRSYKQYIGDEPFA